MTRPPALIAYADGWDTASRTAVAPLTPAQAQARDRDGRNYVVVLAREFSDAAEDPPEKPDAEAGEPAHAAADRHYGHPGHENPRPAMYGYRAVVLHIAPAHHYVGVWVYDGLGRRVREVDLRMLEPGSLFLRQVSEWRYTDATEPEFADNVWQRFIELFPDGKGQVRTEYPRGNGYYRTPLHSVDERWLPAYRFGDWAALLAATLPDTGLASAFTAAIPVADAAGAAPEHAFAPFGSADTTAPRLLNVPAPGYPTQLDMLFTPGFSARVKSGMSDGITVLDPRVCAVPLALPSGRLVVTDPGVAEGDAPALTVTVPPGTYRVELAYLRWNPYEFMGRTFTDIEACGAVRVVIRDTPTVRWELGLRPGEDVRLLRDGEAYGFDVDTGTGCFADHAAWPVLSAELGRLCKGPGLPDEPDEQSQIVDARTGGSAVWFPLPMDGTHPLWIGRDAEGEVTCFAVQTEWLDEPQARA